MLTIRDKDNGSVPLKIMNNTKISDLSSLRDYMFIYLPYNPSTIHLHFLSNKKGRTKNMYTDTCSNTNSSTQTYHSNKTCQVMIIFYALDKKANLE